MHRWSFAALRRAPPPYYVPTRASQLFLRPSCCEFSNLHLLSVVSTPPPVLSRSFVTSVAHSASVVAENHIKEGRELIERGLPFKALQEFNAALRLKKSSENEDSLELAEIYHCIADTTFFMEKYSETEQALKRVLSILRTNFGDDSLDVAVCLQNTAELYQAQANAKNNPKAMEVVKPDVKKLKAALPLMRRALQLKEAHLKTREHDDVVDCVYGMGEILIQLGESKKAVKYFEEVHPWFTKHKDHSDRLLCLNNLQLCYKDLGLDKRETHIKKEMEQLESEVFAGQLDAKEPTMKDFEEHMRKAEPLRARLDSDES